MKSTSKTAATKAKKKVHVSVTTSGLLILREHKSSVVKWKGSWGAGETIQFKMLLLVSYIAFISNLAIQWPVSREEYHNIDSIRHPEC